MALINMRRGWRGRKATLSLAMTFLASLALSPIFASPAVISNGGFRPSKDYLLNFPYRVPRLSSGDDICPLKKGTYVEPAGVKVSARLFSTGDINNDGLVDAAVLLDDCGGGSGVFGSLVFLLNDGHKLVQLDGISYPVGDRDITRALTIANGRVQIDKLERKVGESMAIAPSVRRTISIALRDTAQIVSVGQYFDEAQVIDSRVPGQTAGQAKECFDGKDYLSDFGSKLNGHWQQTIAYAKDAAAQDDNPKTRGHWAMPPNKASQVVIDCVWRTDKDKDPLSDMVLTKSSGNAWLDKSASSALTDLASLGEIANAPADAPNWLPVRCTFDWSTENIKNQENGQTKITVERRAVLPKIWSIRHIFTGGTGGAGEASGQTESERQPLKAVQLIKAAQNFAYVLNPDTTAAAQSSTDSTNLPTNYRVCPLSNGQFKDDGLEIDCKNVATGDINADGRPDVVAHLQVTYKKDSGAAALVSDQIAVLLQTPTGLTQVGRDNFILNSAAPGAKVKAINIVKGTNTDPNYCSAKISWSQAAAPLRARTTVLNCIGHFEADYMLMPTGATTPVKQTACASAAEAALLGKTINAAWLGVRTSDGAQPGQAKANKEVGGAPSGPLRVRLSFDAERSQVIQWVILASNGDKAFDASALQSLLSDSLLSYVHKDDEYYSRPTNAFPVVDCTFASLAATGKSPTLKAVCRASMVRLTY